MSQGTYSLSNQTRTAFRSALNTLLLVIATRNSGATAPPDLREYMHWPDTTAGVLKRRNAANSAWVIERTLEETFVTTRSSNTILGVKDRDKMFRATATFTQTLDAAATLTDGWFTHYRVDAGTTVTFDPNGSETIDGATTKVVIGPDSGVIWCSGSTLHTIGFSKNSYYNRTVMIGDPTPRFGGTGVDPGVEIHSIGSGAFKTMASWANSANGNVLNAVKARSGVVGTHAIVQADDAMYTIFCYGSDGTTVRQAARLEAKIDGTPGASDMPGRWSFYTTPDGSATPVENLRIRASGQLTQRPGVAIPAGGALTMGCTFSSTADFGVFVGSGAPTIAAAKGSLYLRSDGSSASTRAYIATDSSGSWAAITTAS